MWGCHILCVELSYFFQGIVYIFRVFPGVVFCSIAFPLDQVLKSLLEHPAVQNFFHDVLLFAVNEFWGW